MSAMIDTLDSFVSNFVHQGENGHVELDWSNDVQEKIVQFDFQCVRTDANGVAKLETILDGLLDFLSKQTDPGCITKRDELLVALYKMIGKTRDVNGGKGEYTLSYMMLLTWRKYYPNLALRAFQMFVIDPKDIGVGLDSQEPYGSWKDVKYFCKYILDNGGTMEDEFIKNCIDGININLRLDNTNYESALDKNAITLASKWVPREGSKKFGFLYDALATNYFPEYTASVNYVPIAHRELTRKKALDKCRTQYRKLCSKLNKHLDTVQIKQCSKAWSTIEHNKTTSITMAKQRKAFLNKKAGNNDQRTEDPDRIECAENLRNYLESLKKEGKEVKGKNIGLTDFTKQAKALAQWKHGVCQEYFYFQDGQWKKGIEQGHYYVPKSEEADILNSQWRDNSNKKNANGLGPMVAMCDLSGSMEGDPLDAAIALSCRVAEKSILGRRVMTFSAEPTWINLDEKTDFTDMVMEILANNTNVGLNTDFYKALDLILTEIVQRHVPPSDVEKMVLAIFSDMQIDDCLCYTPGATSYAHGEWSKKKAYHEWSVMHEKIKQKYAEVGMQYYGEPLNPPHILFWNLRSTGGFPTLSTEAGCSMMSGFDPTILNLFCELGMDALKGLTPYNMLMKQLDNPRYAPLETVIRASLISS